MGSHLAQIYLAFGLQWTEKKSPKDVPELMETDDPATTLLDIEPYVYLISLWGFLI